MTTISLADYRRDESLRPKRILTKATITGIKPNGDPIWTYVTNEVERSGQGWRETPIYECNTNGGTNG